MLVAWMRLRGEGRYKRRGVWGIAIMVARHRLSSSSLKRQLSICAPSRGRSYLAICSPLFPGSRIMVGLEAQNLLLKPEAPEGEGVCALPCSRAFFRGHSV